MVINEQTHRLRQVVSAKRSPATVADRRQRIVDACVEELHENGFPRIKVESVAARANIDKKTLYDYIEKKEDLLVLVFEQYLPKLLNDIREARQESEDCYEQLFRMLSTHTQIISDSPHFVLFLYREVRYLDRGDQQNVLALVNDIHHEYSSIFSKIQRHEMVSPLSDPILQASSALTLIDMIGLHRSTLGLRNPRDIAAHIYRSLTGPQAPKLGSDTNGAELAETHETTEAARDDRCPAQISD